MEENKPFWLEFIRMYRSLPSLWKLNSPDYTNRVIKKKAYARLVQKLREKYSHANRELAVKKINVIRTNYRREWKKIKENIMAVAEEGADIYVPSLWYYNEMTFLDDQQVPPKNIKSRKSENETEEPQEDDNDRTSEHEVSSSKISSVKNPAVSIWSNKDEMFPKPKKIKSDEDDDPLLNTNIEYILSSSQDDHSEDIIEYWKSQYTKLDSKQKILCRKMISDVLFHSSLGELEDRHVTKMQEILLQRTETYSPDDIIVMNTSRSSTPNQRSYIGIKECSNDFSTQNISQSIENADSISHSSEEVTAHQSPNTTMNELNVSFPFEVKANLKLMIKLNWSSEQIIDALKEVYADEAPNRKELIQLVQQLQESDDEE